jgi:group I intron endonuclease
LYGYLPSSIKIWIFWLYGWLRQPLEILEYCEPSELLEREDYYFKLLNPEYNISNKAGSPMLGRNHSEQSKAKISASNLGKKHAPLKSLLLKCRLENAPKKPRLKSQVL